MDFSAQQRKVAAGVLLAVALVFMLSMARASGAHAAPFAKQATLTPSDEIGHSYLGRRSVALSRNGNTALIGGEGDNNGQGAAWVFVRKRGKWTEQAKLIGAGESGEGWFGSSVALSADGKTALVGGWADNNFVGAAWVFRRSGSTWTQQGPKLTGGGEIGKGWFSVEAVALSADGNTALIGAQKDNERVGAAWVFRRSGSTWTQQGEKLTGGGEVGGGDFGSSVALSANGSTALIAGFGDNYQDGYVESEGAAWLFTRSGSTWSQQGEKHINQTEPDGEYFAAGVALSASGKTVLVGESPATHYPSRFGGGFGYTRAGSTWTQQGARLENSEPEEVDEQFGRQVALSADGNTALIGNGYPASAWVFIRSGLTWSEQPGALLNGNPEGGIAVSGDASTALLGTTVYGR